MLTRHICEFGDIQSTRTLALYKQFYVSGMSSDNESRKFFQVVKWHKILSV
jgi:hypothetical protein